MSTMLLVVRPTVHLSYIYDVYLQPHGLPFIIPVYYNVVHFITTSGYFLAEISVSSRRKLFIFII